MLQQDYKHPERQILDVDATTPSEKQTCLNPDLERAEAVNVRFTAISIGLGIHTP